MATLNLGAIRYNWKGAWSNSTAYVINDVVSNGGNSYVAIQAGTNQAVGNATAYWNIMSSAGTNGSNGTDVGTTLTTQGDLLYRDGSGLQRLAKGSAAQTLKMNSAANAPEWATVATPTSAFLKSYIKLFKGGQSISGLSASSPEIIANYNIDVTPASSASVFLATYSINVGSHVDHTMFQAVAKSGSGSYQKLGTGKSGFYNSNTYFDFGSFDGFGDNNSLGHGMHTFYHAPGSTNVQTFGIYGGQHGGTAYFGRSSNSTSDDYTALGMSLRIDEYAASTNCVYSQYASG